MGEMAGLTAGFERGTAFRSAANRRRYRHWAGAIGLALADASAFLLAAQMFRIGRPVPEILFLPRTSIQQSPVDVFVLLAGLFVLVRFFAGDYRRRTLFWDSARQTTVTLLLMAMPCFAILALVPGRYSLLAEVGSWTFLLVGVPVMRHLVRNALSLIGIWQVPTAVVGVGSRTADVYTALSSALCLGCDIRWLASEPSMYPLVSRQRSPKRLEMSDPARLADALTAEGCEQVVIVSDDTQSPSSTDLIQRLVGKGMSVSFVPSFRRLPVSGVRTSYFFGKDILIFEVRTSLRQFSSRFAKRLFDVVASFAALIVVLPAFLIVGVLIKLHDGGPLFYRQRRVGRRGVPFMCLKFRTMTVNADQMLARWRHDNPALYAEFLKSYKLVKDPRITAIGKWLRKYSVDELPQLINVLKGDMSFVGPRPIVEQELVEHYGSAAQIYKSVRPGITGLWQVSGRSDTSYAERVVYDEWYILNWSFWYDIVILLQTFWSVVRGRGAY